MPDAIDAQQFEQELAEIDEEIRVIVLTVLRARGPLPLKTLETMALLAKRREGVLDCLDALPTRNTVQ